MINKGLVAKNFSKYAHRYDEYCSIQNLCAVKLTDMIGADIDSNILEIGCGTGNYTRLLTKMFPGINIIAIDISKEMIEAAKNKPDLTELSFIVSDAESIEFEEKFDLITSNATFQWFHNLESTLLKYRDLLTKNGVISFSMFGPLTFRELNTSLNELYNEDIPISSSRFIDKTEMERILKSIFGENFTIIEEIVKEEHESLLELLKKIKYTGTRGNGTNGKGIWTPRSIGHLEEIYLRQYNHIEATYQVFFCRATK